MFQFSKALNSALTSGLRLIAAASILGLVGLAQAHAGQKTENCVKNAAGEKILVICKDGVVVEDMTTQSVSVVNSATQEPDVTTPTRRFRYEDF